MEGFRSQTMEFGLTLYYIWIFGGEWCHYNFKVIVTMALIRRIDFCWEDWKWNMRGIMDLIKKVEGGALEERWWL